MALAELDARKKLAGPSEREESPRDKGKGRAEPPDDDGPPAETSDEGESDDEDKGETFESWGGI